MFSNKYPGWKESVGKGTEYYAVANAITVSGKVILVIPVSQDVDGRRPPDEEEILKRIKLPEKYHGPFDMDQDDVEWLTEGD
jgi:hypothetical protein